MNAQTKEITLAVSELKEALPGLTKIIGKSRTLPVLNTVRIRRNQEGIVTLQATDLDSFVTYTTKAAQQGEPTEVLVPVDQLTKATKSSSPKEDIGIVPESKDKVKIRYNIAGNRVEQTISTLPVGDYPPSPSIRQPGTQLEPQFGQALKEALDCCSDDSSRYVLQGACLDVNDKKFHYIVGTNGRMLFSANSFCFNLEKSVIIPDSKFLNWSDFLNDQPAFISVEPGKEAEKAKDGKPAVEAEAGWIKLESPRWTFVTREIEGQFPNWKQCVPESNSKWTQVVLSEDAAKQLIQVIPNLPGADCPNSTIQLRVDKHLTIEGKNNDQDEWTAVPIQAVNVAGDPVAIALNREYVLKGLRFGLNKLEIQDSLTAMIMSKGAGKKMIIMPLRMEGDDVKVSPTPQETTPTETTAATEQPQPQPNPEAQTQERIEMPKKNTITETATEKVAENITAATAATKEIPITPTPVKSLVEHVESIKDCLKSVLREVSTMVDAVKAAEKEKRITEKEIEAVRAKLRQIQNVSI
jgi:DNA polymerase III sliding clamp (beta) subunit (PCNA family)